MKFHHVGIATNDIEAASALVRATFDIVTAEGPTYDPLQDVNLMMLTDVNGYRIELVAGPRVAAFVSKRQYLYHTCYEVNYLEHTMQQLQACGATVISPPTPAVLFGGRRVTFLISTIGIVELLEAVALA